MIDVLVSNNDRDHYPALVDPAESNGEGYVKPWFSLETVRRIAEKTQADAAEFGHDSIDTVHVVDGGEENGEPRVLVVVICWMDVETKGVDGATTIVEPVRYRQDAEGDEGHDPEDEGDALYCIGGFPWCWYALDDDLNPLIPFRAEK
ncbi:hypothetical protein [Streptomyces kronopolitis]|uniref:hypothetical protein n=1 Tax=Streptomyces kronopolitis TaxID=1612435 RepID=UPI00342E07BA